ncbi:hypothetical protein BDR05DRAFT_969366 [Suillus weaverae]|nr:hypothetical protein BDR05DRAFT_969366 [Suillus weaverae]
MALHLAIFWTSTTCGTCYYEMSSSPRVCYSYSQTASCRFGSQCRFAHGEGFEVTNDVDRDDKEREQASRDFKDALFQQFNEIYGTDVNNLTSWRTLCQIVHISPIPDTLESCREAVKATHVNIVDLVDTKVTGEPVTVVSEVDQSEYTISTGKFFPRDNAYAGGLLRYLLRRIINPRQERVSKSGLKTQSRRRRR